MCSKVCLNVLELNTHRDRAGLCCGIFVPETTKNCSLCPYSGGTHSGKLTWIDSKEGSRFAAESEAIIEVGGQKKEQDAGSIKGEEGLEMKIIRLAEKADNQKVKDSEEPNITKEFGMIPATEEAEERHV